MRRTVLPAAAVCLVVSLLLSLGAAGLARARQKAGPNPLLSVPDSHGFWWGPDGKTLAVLVLSAEKREGGLRLYDAASGKVRAEIKDAGPSPLSGVGLSFTPDGRTLISHSDRVRLYDTADGRLLREFAPGTEPINYYRKIFTGRETYSTTYNSSTGMEEPSSGWEGPSDEDELMELPTRSLSDRVVSPDGKSLLVRAAPGGARAQVFDLGTGELKFTLEPLPDPGSRKKGEGSGEALGEFSPDGRLILTTHRDRTPRVWNAETGKLVANLAPQTDKVIGARFSPDGRLVATTSFGDGVVRIWEAATGRLLHAVGSKQDRNYFAAWNPAHDSFVTKTRKWEVNLWDAGTGRLLGRLDGKAAKEKFDETLAFVYSPDGRLLLTQARNEPSFWANLGVKGKPRMIAHLWDARTGAHVAGLRDNKPLNPGNYDSDKFFWSPAGDLLITAGATIKVWSRRGELVRELEGNAVARAGLSADGRLLAVMGDELFGSIWSDVGGVAKILVGRLPKFKASATLVWQIEDN